MLCSNSANVISIQRIPIKYISSSNMTSLKWIPLTVKIYLTKKLYVSLMAIPTFINILRIFCRYSKSLLWKMQVKTFKILNTLKL